MNELNSFTVERLEEILQTATFSGGEELKALARIALAAKRAEPVSLESAIEKFKEYNIGFPVEKLKTDFVISWCLTNLTPQLNSPEIPDGWKMLPIAPTDAMQVAAANAIRFDTTGINKLWTGKRVFDAMIAAAPEKPL